VDNYFDKYSFLWNFIGGFGVVMCDMPKSFIFVTYYGSRSLQAARWCDWKYPGLSSRRLKPAATGQRGS